MKKFVTNCLGIAAFLAASIQAAPVQSQSLASSHGAPYRALLDRYCVTCHNEQLRTAELVLSGLDVEKVSEGAEVWEKVVRKLRAGAMPPAGMPRPEKTSSDAFATYLETELDQAARNNPKPGKPAVRRLNRAEYTNAIRDLLAVEIDGGSLLPGDDSMFGFDSIGEVLTVSPLLLERYLSAARKISRMAIGDPQSQPLFEVYNVSKYLMQDERVDEALPFGSRGGVAIRHHFPLDGEYVVQIRLGRNSRAFIRGLLDEPHLLDVRLDGERVKLFTVGGEKHGESAPLFSTASLGDPEQEKYERTSDEKLEVRFSAKAGTRLVGISFLEEMSMPEGPLRQRMTLFDFAQYKGGKPAVARVSIGGPYDATGLGETPSRQKIFTCRPASEQDEEGCAKEILGTLARRAYRRPLSSGDLQTLLEFYREGHREQGFEAGIQAALERILVGPEFLYRIERNPTNLRDARAHQVSDLDLASRLSFFLWSSIPDDELLGLAEAGRLAEPAILENQVRRMLGDSRSRALVENFVGQWLLLRNLRSASPDREAFPYFDENLKRAFIQETEFLIHDQLSQDRSVVDLLSADYTFVNQRLAEHYGIENIYGNRFRRVQLEDEERKGLLGQGSILTVTSYGNRTSPVIRGKWVLENILGAPPPPPPPDVPELETRAEDGRVLSMREQMEKHRANPVCASCHARMDPLGFALENFNAVGTWRLKDAGKEIDPSGVLPDGTEFQGPSGLREVLISRREEFVTTVTEKLLTYALGRGVEYTDLPTIRSILRESAESDYRWSSLILGIVNSTPFQMRRSATS